MQKKRRFGMKNVIASVLTAALVLTSTPSGILAGELLEVETEEMEGISPVEELAETAPAEGAEDALSLFGEDDADEAMFSVSEDVEAVEAVTESDVADEEDATETVTEAAAESITDEVTETVTEAETEAETDAEDEAEVDEAEVVEAAAVETNSATVEGIRGWYYTYFTAELSGAKVNVAVPSFFGTSAAYMQASYVDAAGYEEMINADNYGKVAADLKAIEITFLTRNGKAARVGTVGAEIELASTGAEAYVMYQQGKSSMRKAVADTPYFSFNINNGGTYVFAGLVADGADRAEGVTSNGTTTFDLTTSDGTGITASTSSKAFASDTMYMEAENALTEDTVTAALLASDAEEAEVVQAIDISFHNEEGTETEPAKDVTVTIATPLSTEGEYQLVHIKDNGETEIVENAVFDENGVTFTVDEFSTFVLTWKKGSEEFSATIHWGTLSGSTFTELSEGSTVTLDTTASTISLENSFAGYIYTGAVYCEEGQTIASGASIKSVLNKTDNGWECTVVTAGESGTTETAVPVAANSHIYVTYTAVEEPLPSGDGDEDIPSPKTTKTVTDNGDGTYTIQLDIAGAIVKEDQSHYANVLVILDATQSMGQNGGAKWTNAKAAMKTLIETLTEGDNAQNAGKVDFALVTFGRSATVVQNWTKDNAGFKTTCAGINMVDTQGTNWEAGMRGGLYGVLSSYPQGETAEKHDPTYVIFLTDGDPNTYYFANEDIGTTYGSWWDQHTVTAADVASATEYGDNHNLPGYNGNNATSANRSADEAKTIAASTKLYGIYCGDTGQTPSGESFNRLVGVIQGPGQGGQKAIAANASTIESEFKAIAETIAKEMGASNVATDDGIPSLSSISSNVAGEAGGYEYYKSTDGGETFTEWTNAPGAIYSSDNGVTWDLGSEGTLAAGSVYRIKFTVWPSQAGYDLIADLNNGKVTMDDDALKAAGIEKTQNSDGTYSYSLMTNTHLNTTYTFNDQNYSDAPEWSEEAMPLPTETVSVKKLWPDNLIDTYGAAVYRDPQTGETKTATEISLELTKDGAKYLDVLVTNKGKDGVVGTDDDWKKDDIFISCGFMNVVDGVATIKEPGHDYQIVEPPEFMYYWDLISDVYHPMVINGTATLLVLDVDASSSDVDNNNYFAIGKNEDGSPKIYKMHSSTENTLEASNYRRSNLNLTKKIFDYDGETAKTDTDAVFTYKVKVKDTYSTDGYVWFSAWDPDLASMVTDEWVTGTGVTAEIKDGNRTGYYYAPNETELTMKIKAGWNIRFLNLYHGSTFSIEETDMPGNYEFMNVAAAAQYKFVHSSNADWYTATPSEKKVEGTITEPNNNYTITYSNKVKSEFYIYHSGVAGDGNLETIPMTAVNADGTYNLYAKTTVGTLYGGYYLDYEAKGTYKDDGVKGTGGVKYDGVTQTWLATDHQAQTVDGTKMKPTAGETYYIKEVPYAYLQNYIHYQFVEATNALTSIYMVSAVDDLNYNETGFILKKTNEDSQKASVVKTLTFKKNGKVTHKLTPDGVFGKRENAILKDQKQTLTNRLTYLKASTDYFAANTEYTMLPYWKTLDGILVTGYYTRTVKIGDLNVSGLSATDAHVE